MPDSNLKADEKKAALASGGDVVDVVSISDLPEHTESMCRILPGEQSVVVVASRRRLAPKLLDSVNALGQNLL